MRRPSRRGLTIAGAGATAALGLALVAPHVAFAQDPTPSPSASTSPSASGSGSTANRDADCAKRQDELATALAKELGIDKDKVAAALAKVQSELPKPSAPPAGAKTDRTAELKTRLDAAVKAGTITQAEEDAIIKAAGAGVLGGGPGGPGGPGHGGGKPPAAATPTPTS